MAGTHSSLDRVPYLSVDFVPLIVLCSAVQLQSDVLQSAITVTDGPDAGSEEHHAGQHYQWAELGIEGGEGGEGKGGVKGEGRIMIKTD